MSNPLNSAFWIWDNKKTEVNTYLIFQKQFEIKNINPNNKYTLFISADSQYEVFINGSFIGSGQYPDYECYKVYDEFDVGHNLKAGDNQLIINAYWQGESSFTYKLAQAGIIFALYKNDVVLIHSDETTLCAEYTNYKSGHIEKITPQLSFSFKYDARETLPPFKPADIIHKTVKLYPRPIKQLELQPEKKAHIISHGIFIDTNPDAPTGYRMQYAYMAHRDYNYLNVTSSSTVLPSSDGLTFNVANNCESHGIYLIVDLEETSSGYLTLDIDLPNESLVLIGFGEHLDDLRVRSYVGERNFCAYYYGKKGRNRFIHRFKRIGLRYLQLFVYSHSFTLHYAGICSANYPVSTISKFICDDSLHNKIYEVCVKTLHLCMHEHYEDCPWREQAMYTMDSRNQMLCGYFTFSEYDFARACLRLMALSIRDDDLLELCSPGEIEITIPSFSAIFVTALQEYLLYSGDYGFVREVLPVARRIVDGFIRRIDPDCGLVPFYYGKEYWNFYEWQEGLAGGMFYKSNMPSNMPAVTYDAPLNAFISMAIQSLSYIYNILQEPEAAEFYSKTANQLNRCMDKAFWEPEESVYFSFFADGKLHHTCELTQSLMAYCGACPSDKLPLILEAISQKRLLPITLSYSIFKYEALLKIPELYGQYVFDEIAEIWGKMLFKGATTFWETEKGSNDFKNAGSLCHGWSAIPAYIYFRYGLGIKVIEPGFASYEIEPVKGIKGCRGFVKIPPGTITV